MNHNTPKQPETGGQATQPHDWPDINGDGDKCPVCGSMSLRSFVSVEYSTEKETCGYDDCEACGWRGIWSVLVPADIDDFGFST